MKHWVRLTKADGGHVWVNLRAHDYMLHDAGTGVTEIWIHDGEHVDVVESPEEIFLLLAEGDDVERDDC